MNKNPYCSWKLTLLLSFLTALLYSSFIIGGIFLSFLLLQELLDIPMSEDIYMYVFILVSLVFNTWFFIAGIPKNINELEKKVNSCLSYYFIRTEWTGEFTDL